jgi:hypothetical protein
MSIYSKFEAYEHLEIGLQIGYYVGDPTSERSQIKNGIITDLPECDTFEDDCLPCHCSIEINNGKPECFRYGKRTGIRYVVVNNFLNEEDFKV